MYAYIQQIDLVSEKEKTAVRARIQSINSAVEIIECTHSKVDPDKLLDIKGFDLEQVLSMEPGFLDTDQEHLHDASVSSVSFQHEEPVNIGKLQNWIGQLINAQGQQLFRYKGVINVMHMPKRFVFQGVSLCVYTYDIMCMHVGLYMNRKYVHKCIIHSVPANLLLPDMLVAQVPTEGAEDNLCKHVCTHCTIYTPASK
jgi:hypothetical protein